MCGICGVALKDGAPADAAALGRMAAALAHRGPDDEGIEVPRRGRPRAPPPRDHRPLRGRAPADGQRGRVGADRLQRRDLQLPRAARRPREARGHRFRSHSDTEVIVHLYEELGHGLRRPPARHVRLRHLGRAAPAPLSRARPGRQEAALLRSTPRRRFLFGSEIKAILAAGGVPREPGPAGARPLPHLPVRPVAVDRLRGDPASCRPRTSCCWRTAARRSSATGASTTGRKLHGRPRPPRGGAARAAARGGAPAPGQRRAARGLPLRRRRLERRGRAHGPGDGPRRCAPSPSAFAKRSFDELAVRPPRGRALRHAAHRVGRRAAAPWRSCRGSSGTSTSRSPTPRRSRPGTSRSWRAST